ncbi:MAG: sulfotransferase domain-containing protein [Bacteroidota bacterium]|nr:sulfotransferase domain-containing protein [Bacteroidota bacterium]
MFDHISQHPKVLPSSRKEVQFFGTRYRNGWNWYRSHFPLSLGTKGFLTGESTPYYLFHPMAPSLIASRMKDLRIIVMLRNPVERAYSHFKMQQRNGVETFRSFQEAIDAEDERIRSHMDKVSIDPYYYSEDHLRFAYLHRGLYGQQLERWFSFFPRENFHFIKSEDFFQDPQKALFGVQDFLDLDRMDPGTLKPKNQGNYSISDFTLPEDWRDRYFEDMKKLKSLTGIDFNWDL